MCIFSEDIRNLLIDGFRYRPERFARKLEFITERYIDSIAHLSNDERIENYVDQLQVKVLNLSTEDTYVLIVGVMYDLDRKDLIMNMMRLIIGS